MDNQDQRNLNAEIDSLIPEEEQLVEETSPEMDFPAAEFSTQQQPEDDWDDDEEYLEDQTGRQMLYWIGGGLLLLVLTALLFLVLGEENPSDLSSVNKQIQEIDARLVTMESSAKAWNSGLDRLEANQQSTIDQINQLSVKIVELSRQVSAKPVAPAVIHDQPKKSATPALKKPAAPTPKKSSKTPRAFHIVKPGDTLYSIHKKYKVTLNGLRKLNGLKEHEPIYTGNKIYLE